MEWEGGGGRELDAHQTHLNSSVAGGREEKIEYRERVDGREEGVNVGECSEAAARCREGG